MSNHKHDVTLQQMTSLTTRADLIKLIGADALAKIEGAGLRCVPAEATLDMIAAAHIAMFQSPFNGDTAPMVGAGIDASSTASPFGPTFSTLREYPRHD